jgi:uncharacterized protein
VDISQALRDQYPEEMTIVLQYQFWGLTVDDDGFSVGLSFNKTPQTLHIPFHALTQFSDPAVQFQLPFQPRAATAAPAPRRIETRIAAVEKSAPEISHGPERMEERGAVVSLDAFRKK